MIDGKIFKFGYGDIAIGATPGGHYLTFTPFKPPQKLGTCCNALFANGEIEQTGEPIYIRFDSFRDFEVLKVMLESVRIRKEDRIFDFKGYIFDFSNYNEISVDVFEMQRSVLLQEYCRCAAC